MATDEHPGLSRGAIVACAVICGAMVANLYYAQPLVAAIAHELGLGAGLAGLITTLTQLGYGLGLFLIVPLADRFENRRLIVATLVATSAALAALAAAPSRLWFLAAAMLVGITAAGAQVVVPFAAALTPERRRGRTIGDVMAGLLAGIMLARPVASVVAGAFGWRALFAGAALAGLFVAAWAWRALPDRRPDADERYGAILRSLGRILATTPALQRRAVYQGLTFAIFNIFWTAAPIELGRRFGLGPVGIALFALAGAAGALAAPIAGRLGDRGYLTAGTAGALATITLSAGFAAIAGGAGSLALLVLFAVTLDGATQVNQVLGQRVIYTLPDIGRGRANAIYMTTVFLLGAAGSAAATVADARAGWTGAMMLAGGIGAVALALFATEFLPSARRAAEA